MWIDSLRRSCVAPQDLSCTQETELGGGSGLNARAEVVQ